MLEERTAPLEEAQRTPEQQRIHDDATRGIYTKWARAGTPYWWVNNECNREWEHFPGKAQMMAIAEHPYQPLRLEHEDHMRSDGCYHLTDECAKKIREMIDARDKAAQECEDLQEYAYKKFGVAKGHEWFLKHFQ